MGDDDSSLRGGGLAEHHELDPLRDAVEESDETLQDGVVHRAAVRHKAVVVLELKGEKKKKKTRVGGVNANLRVCAGKWGGKIVRPCQDQLARLGFCQPGTCLVSA